MPDTRLPPSVKSPAPILGLRTRVGGSVVLNGVRRRAVVRGDGVLYLGRLQAQRVKDAFLENLMQKLSGQFLDHQRS